MGPQGTFARVSKFTQSFVVFFRHSFSISGIERRAVLDAPRVGPEALVLRERGPARRFAERCELPVVADREHQPGVLRRERLVRNDVRVRGAAAHGRLARHEVVERLVRERRDLRVEQREVDVLAAAGLFALDAAPRGSRSTA